MTRAELLALAERVEAGETGHDLRMCIAQALLDRGDFALPEGLTELPAWETSIDAQALLPAQVVNVIWLGALDGSWKATALATPDADDERWSGDGRAYTEPAARLAAILRAMAEKEPEA